MSDIPVSHVPAASLLAGVSRRDITAPVGIYARQWGAAKHDAAEGVHKPLTLTALAMRPREGDGPTMLLVSFDGCSFFGGPGGTDAGDEWRLRGAVIDALKLENPAVMLAITHSHAACTLSVNNADKPGGEYIDGYLNLISKQLVEAAREAVGRLQPATLTAGTGWCGMAGNRNLPDPDPAGDERYLCGYNPEAPFDGSVTVGRVTRDDDGRVLATMVNYACHPTTLAWENRLLSPDYVGAMRETVEQYTGQAPCLFLQGASGDQGPREQYVGHTDIADEHGRHLGMAAATVLAGMLPPGHRLAYEGVMESGAPLGLWRRRPFLPSGTFVARRIAVTAPLKDLPSVAQLESELKSCDDRTMAERIRRKITLVKSVGEGPTIDLPVWMWRLGDVYFVGHTNEADASLQVSLRQTLPHAAVFVMNIVNSNGGAGYVLPRASYDGPSLYQAWQTAYAPGAYEAVDEEVRNALLEMAQA